MNVDKTVREILTELVVNNYPRLRETVDAILADPRLQIVPNTAEFITVAEAAKRTQVSNQTIRRYVESGVLRAVRIGDKIIRIDPASLENLTVPVVSTTTEP